MSYPEHSTGNQINYRPVQKILGIVFLSAFLIAPVLAAAAESVSGPDERGTTLVLLWVVLGAVAVAALMIAGLIYWSQKEDHLGEMVHFCLKFLVHSENEAERCSSAKALGKAHDPGALLVLFDVALDEDEKEAVRTAASEALHDMGRHVRKHKKVISDLELAAEQGDFRGIIKILKSNFELGRKTYAQSAYLIARQYMRLGRYINARKWLVKAEFRNRRLDLYGNQIRHWIDWCNIRLLEEADAAFKEAGYQHAKEQYAALDSGLSEADRRKYSLYLRTACVFARLKDFRNADQSLLQGLAHNHDAELTLTLVPLIQTILEPGSKQGGRNEALEAIDKRVDEIMNVLLARKFSNQH